jgi:hypothetical protein
LTRQVKAKALCSARLTSLTTASPPARASALPRALVRLSARAQRELWGIRLTRLYAFGIGISYSVLVLTGPLSPGVAPGLWMKAVTTASWIAGIGALSLARELTERDATQGVTALARLRGYGAPELERARVAAGALKLAATVAIPGALVALTALLRWRSLPGVLTALALLLFTALYAALFGVTLSALARACSRALPGRGRLLLLAIVLGPWLLASGIGVHLPSIPGGFGWLLARLAEGSR